MQTTFNDSPAIGQEGEIASSVPSESISKVAEGAVKVGRACVQGTADNQCATPSAVAADVDAILLSDSTMGNASGSSYAVGDLDGAVAGGLMNPARNITMTFANDADWDATTATVTGIDENGKEISESFSIPDGGNATVTGSSLFAKVTAISIPAQSGDAAGSVGIGTKLGTLKALGISRLDKLRATADFADGEPVPMMTKGRLHVITENACSPGDPCFVRLVISGSEELGALRSTADGSAGAPDCAPLKGAKFVTTAGAGEVAVLELDLVGN